MKYCTHCGEPIEDDAAFCVTCGAKAKEEPVPAEMSKRDKNLTLAAEILMIIACAISFIAGIIFLIMAIVGAANGVYFLEFDVSEADKELIESAYIAACVTVAIAGLVPLAYGIPMTVYVFKADKEGRPLSTAFKVCTLILMSVIPGILLLLRNEPSAPEPVKVPVSPVVPEEPNEPNDHEELEESDDSEEKN